jgi:hypothetical protein
MRQLVETDQRDLRALPGINRAVELQVRELDPVAASEAEQEKADPAQPEGLYGAFNGETRPG